MLKKKYKLSFIFAMIFVLLLLTQARAAVTYLVVSVPSVYSGDVQALGKVIVSIPAGVLSEGDSVFFRLPNDFHFKDGHNKSVSAMTYSSWINNQDGATGNRIVIPESHSGEINGLYNAVDINYLMIDDNEVKLQFSVTDQVYVNNYDCYLYLFLPDIYIPGDYSGEIVFNYESPTGSGLPCGSLVVGKASPLVLTSVNLTSQVTNDGTQLTLTVRARSDSPVDWINMSLYGPSGNIFGGGHGCTFTEVVPGVWEYSETYTVSKYAPSGAYTYKDISVENKGMITSDNWPEEIGVAINNPPTPLVVALSNPVNGASNIPTDAIVNLTYNQDIKQGKNFSSIAIQDEKGDSVAISNIVNGRELKISPLDSLQNNTVYTVKIPEGAIQDLEDNITSSFTLVFTTKNISPGGGGGGGGGGGAITPQAVTSTTGSAAVNPSKGGTVSLGNDALVTIPAEAMEGTSSVTVTVQQVISPPATSSGFMILGTVYEFSVGGQDHYTFNKPVTLTFSFDPSALAPGEKPEVYYYDEAAQKWVSLGGTVSGSTITVTVDHFSKFAVIAAEKTIEKPIEKSAGTLKDITGHWAESNIKALVSSGVICGYPDGSFKPDSAITRAEFAAVLVKAFKLEAKGGKVFADTTSYWAKDVISTASAYGIISGYSDASFGPDDPMTREQMAVMIVKAVKLATPLSIGTSFADNAKISGWALGSVALAVQKGVIAGYPDNTFRPQGNTTRAEAATVIINALK